MIWLALIALSGCKVEPAPGVASEELPATNRMARLTHLQYENTVQDLLQLDESAGMTISFIGDGLHEGFENNSEYLQVGPELWQDYQRAAETLGANVVQNADLYSRVVPEDPRTGEMGVDFSAQVEAEGDEVSRSTGGSQGDAWNVWSNGTVSWDIELPESGTYTLSSRVWGDQAGPDLVRVALGVDGTELLASDVSGGSEGSAEVFEVEFEGTAGTHTVYVEFLNDYWVEGLEDRNLVVDWLAVEGEGDVTGASGSGDDEAMEWIKAFGTRAFRRPLNLPELEAYVDLFAMGPELLDSGDDFADGVQVVVTAMLQSPYFLYRIEESTDTLHDGRIFLSDYEIASKLSYAIWNTMPDAALFAAAEAGELKSTEQIREQALRMFSDPRAQAMVDDFHRQLLHLDNYANIYKDTDYYPGYTSDMNDWMRTEAAMYTQEMVFGGHGVHTLFSAPWTIANDELAAVYGAGPVANADANGFGRVDLDPSQRAGLLTQLGFLSLNADPQTESSIHRGVFINLALLCVDLPSPPDNVTALPPVTGEMTNRQRIEAHTGEGTCGEGCHSTMINPPGFAFENYDALGQYRDTDNGMPVDASGTFGTGETFTDAVDFAALMADSPTAHACYMENWLEFMYGRVATPQDASHLQELSNKSRLEDRAILDLLVDLTVSESFRVRTTEVP